MLVRGDNVKQPRASWYPCSCPRVFLCIISYIVQVINQFQTFVKSSLQNQNCKIYWKISPKVVEVSHYHGARSYNVSFSSCQKRRAKRVRLKQIASRWNQLVVRITNKWRPFIDAGKNICLLVFFCFIRYLSCFSHSCLRVSKCQSDIWTRSHPAQPACVPTLFVLDTCDKSSVVPQNLDTEILQCIVICIKASTKYRREQPTVDTGTRERRNKRKRKTNGANRRK